MEFSLVDDKPFTIEIDHQWTESDKVICLTSLETFTMQPVLNNGEAALSNYCQSLLNDILPKDPLSSVSVPSSSNGTSAPEKLNSTLKLYMMQQLPFNQKCIFHISTECQNGFLERMSKLYGEDNVLINLRLSQVKWNVSDGVTFGFEAKELRIETILTQHGHVWGYGCETSEVSIPADAQRSNSISGRLTVSMKLTQNAVDSIVVKRFSEPCLVGEHIKRLLEDPVCSDLVIVAANGKKFKCHKAMLAVRSDVFKTMFETRMKETIKNVLRMRDMSENAVQAFLDFIYNSNLKKASDNCNIAFELLVVADKYHVSDLLSAIAELLIFKPNEWFNVGMSMRLLIFTERQREICQDKNLQWIWIQKKAVCVLKSYAKDSFDILLNSEVYQELFNNDVELAKKINLRLLSFAFE